VGANRVSHGQLENRELRAEWRDTAGLMNCAIFPRI